MKKTTGKTDKANKDKRVTGDIIRAIFDKTFKDPQSVEDDFFAYDETPGEDNTKKRANEGDSQDSWSQQQHAKKPKPDGCDGDFDGDDDGIGFADQNKNKDKKLNDVLTYRGIKMTGLTEFHGDDFPNDEEEGKNLRDFFHNLVNNQQRQDVDILKVFSDADLMNSNVRARQCVLCDCVTRLRNEGDTARTSYWYVIEFDRWLCTKMSGFKLYQLLATVFNWHEASMLQLDTSKDSKYYYVTWKQVKEHMEYHDVTNPIRKTIRQINFYKKLEEELQDSCVGYTTDGKKNKVINTAKVELICKVTKMIKELQVTINTFIAELKQEEDKRRDALKGVASAHMGITIVTNSKAIKSNNPKKRIGSEGVFSASCIF